jgi:hypothetical protein
MVKTAIREDEPWNSEMFIHDRRDIFGLGIISGTVEEEPRARKAGGDGTSESGGRRIAERHHHVSISW